MSDEVIQTVESQESGKRLSKKERKNLNRKTAKQRIAEAESRPPREPYKRTQTYFDIEEQKKQVEQEREIKKQRKEAKELMKKALEEVEQRKKQKKRFIYRDEDSGLSYEEIIYEAIAARSSSDKEFVSMNSLLKYFELHFTNGNIKIQREYYKKTVKDLVEEGVLRNHRGSYGFHKKFRDRRPTDVIPRIVLDRPSYEDTHYNKKKDNKHEMKSNDETLESNNNIGKIEEEKLGKNEEN